MIVGWMDERPRAHTHTHAHTHNSFRDSLVHPLIHGRTHRLDMLERELTLADHAPFAKKLSPPRPPGAVTISVGRANRMQTTPPPLPRYIPFPFSLPCPTPSHDTHKLLTQGMQGVQGGERDYVRQHDSKGPVSLGPASALPHPSRHASPARSVSSVINLYLCICPSIYVCIYLFICLSVCHIHIHLHVYVTGDEHDIPSNCLGSLPGTPCVRAS